MKLAIVLALAAVCLATVYAMPAEKQAKDVKDPAMAAKDVKTSTGAAKDTKDPTTASKDVKDAIKDAKKNKKECAKQCNPSLEQPICVHDPANPNFKPRTFIGQCALDVANCENGSKWVVKSKGECPGSGGVRLS
ncbi:uncharacterized protein LOC107274956 [Cephus cinctus]|uniref:Uncharacterized protein LOC107274956 n=1 Tax=Cephus cinctus TaxID=211228 RepID=A0AAJ7FVA4_CEPCN|nr:uncharacterized protein LOC107274956 [Cephus cinctus]